jgi:hypothetical protein
MADRVVRRARRLGAAARLGASAALAAGAALGLTLGVAPADALTGDAPGADPRAGNAPGPPASRPGRAAIVFLPWSDAAGGDRELLRRLGEPGRKLAVGLTSPTSGGYSSDQMLLDMSQGARIPVRLYGSAPPRLEIGRTDGRGGAGEVRPWALVRRRAEAAPAVLTPGLLGTTLVAGGASAAYIGVAGRSQAEAAVGADRSGRVRVAAVTGRGDIARRAVALWGRSDLLVARLGSGHLGLSALDRLLESRRPGDFVYVVRVPSADSSPGASDARAALSALPLLATAIAAPGLAPGGSFTSRTTRRTGLVAASDVAPSVIGRLGLDVPKAMQGMPIEGAESPGSGSGHASGAGRDGWPSAGAETALRLRDRLGSIVTRRAPALIALLAVSLALAGCLALVRDRSGARTGARIAFLAALWFPGLALAVAAIAAVAPAPPTPAVEAGLIVIGSLVLAAATDRAAPWPRGPALPALAVTAAYALDLASGSSLTATALTGPNPAGGARFFGVGNELETVLSVTVLIGVGAGAAGAGRAAGVGRAQRGHTAPASFRAWPWFAPAAFAVAGLLSAVVLGVGRLGADVGAVVTLGVGTAVAVVSAVPGGAGRVRVVAGIAASALGSLIGLGLLAAIDSLTDGGAHLSRSVLAPGPESLGGVLERRAQTQLGLIGSPLTAAITAIALAVLVALTLGRRRVFAHLAPESARPLRAGVYGSLAAVLAGAVANDSASDMLAIGAALLLLAAGYLRCAPVGSAAGDGERGARDRVAARLARAGRGQPA